MIVVNTRKVNDITAKCTRGLRQQGAVSSEIINGTGFDTDRLTERSSRPLYQVINLYAAGGPMVTKGSPSEWIREHSSKFAP